MADRGIVLDRFEVVRELGLGGAGELLLVMDRKRDGERCALKILRPRSRDPALGPLFRHEFILLSEIRHDSIVGVRDFGVLETGEPFFTMDYVPGENCRAYVRESRLETGEYLDLAAHLLAALGHIHSRGILHRDLKPDNVIMQRRGGRLAPVLVDFGLSVVAGSARPGEATGTMPYIAPEVLAGGRPDARADLYALGVLLFEVATGTSIGPPEDLLRAPNTVLAPSRIRKMMRAAARPTVPAKLERFVSHLMAPTPAARYPSAGAALAALTSLYGDAVAPVRLEASAPSFDPESPLVGRSHPLDALLQRVTALKENVLLDSIVVVGGAAGAGVTRFLTTVRNHAAAGGCMVCVGSTLRELVTEVATHPSFRGTPPAPNEDPTALVFRADAQLVVPPDGVWPILILDDVHTLDERECRALRQWIEALERRTERPRMLLILGGRTDEEGDGSKLLQEVGRAVPMEVRALPPLSVDDIKQALTVILGGTRPPTSVTQALHRASGGNPRLFNELLGVLAAHRVLVVEEGVAALDHDRLKRTKLPRGVADAARLRTECLREASKDLLFRFALIDAPLPVEAARSVSNGELAELLAQRFLILDRGRVRFPDELARRTADLLEGDARSSSLTQLAGAFEKGAPAISARLWAEAGQSDRARFIGLPAAKELRAGGASEEAARLLSKLVGGSPDVEMAYLYGQCLQDLGRSRDIVRMCEPLLQSRTSAKESHDLLLLVTTAIVRLGERERALELLERFDRGTAGERVATLLNAKAGLLYALGRYDEALLESDRAEAAAESVLALQGRLARVRATILRHQGRMKAAMRMEDLLIDAVAADIQPEALIAAHTNRAGYHRVMGRPREGIRDLRRASYLGAELVRPIARARALYSLRFLRSMGRAKTALRVVETARRIFEQAAWVNEVCECLIEEAVCLVDLGNPLEAERRLSRAESLPTASPSPEVRLNEALVRSRLSFLSGHVQAATKTLRSALEDALGHGISKIAVAVEIAECTSDEAGWRDALRVAWTERRADFLPWIRVGLSECAARR
ncbi:MAG: serine/threonine-protein kinase, partial [Planctomycetota bacterium]|nr:serine/threonine-protein kinase [Planctomycetota bacterium]